MKFLHKSSFLKIVIYARIALGVFDVVSKTIEISYGSPKRKPESQIEPFLLLLESIIKPKTHSFLLNVEFIRKPNPFLNVYIANLLETRIEDLY